MFSNKKAVGGLGSFRSHQVKLCCVHLVDSFLNVGRRVSYQADRWRGEEDGDDGWKATELVNVPTYQIITIRGSMKRILCRYLDYRVVLSLVGKDRSLLLLVLL